MGALIGHHRGRREAISTGVEDLPGIRDSITPAARQQQHPSSDANLKEKANFIEFNIKGK
jgi:hypothetical protein